MKWASRFQFFNKTIIVDLNTGAAIVTIRTDPMTIEVMVAAVVDMVEISIGAAIVTIRTDPMAIEVMGVTGVGVMVAAGKKKREKRNRQPKKAHNFWVNWLFIYCPYLKILNT